VIISKISKLNFNAFAKKRQSQLNLGLIENNFRRLSDGITKEYNVGDAAIQ
jgi:hypothetical protein